VKKTSLYLDPDLDEALARRAADEGLTKAEFIRRTLASAMQRPKRPKPQAIGLIDDGPRDVARNVDRYLRETGFGEWRSS
jgi:Ribbon-helix-helix protein, copG family